MLVNIKKKNRDCGNLTGSRVGKGTKKNTRKTAKKLSIKTFEMSSSAENFVALNILCIKTKIEKKINIKLFTNYFFNFILLLNKICQQGSFFFILLLFLIKIILHK